MSAAGDAVRSRLVWVEPGAEQGSHVLIHASPDAMNAREVAVPPGEGFPAGRYLLLAEERWAQLNLNDPTPVFLHENFRAYEKSWVAALDDLSQEAEVADQVYRHVRGAVERELPDGARPIGPTLTMGLRDDLGNVRIRGVCVLARRVAG